MQNIKESVFVKFIYIEFFSPSFIRIRVFLVVTGMIRIFAMKTLYALYISAKIHAFTSQNRVTFVEMYFDNNHNHGLIAEQQTTF